MSGWCRDSSTYRAPWQVDVEVGLACFNPSGAYATVGGFVWAGCVGRGRVLQSLDCLCTGRDDGEVCRRNSPRVRGDLMTEVIDRLVVAVNAHDLDAVASLIHEGYRSEQPAHPGRAFAGRAQMLANWEAMFAGIPNIHAEIRRSVQDGET